MNNNVTIKVNKELLVNMKGANLECTIDAIRDYVLDNNSDLSFSLETGEHTVKMHFKYLGAKCGFSTAKFTVGANDNVVIEYNPPEMLAMGGSISVSIKTVEKEIIPETVVAPDNSDSSKPVQEEKPQNSVNQVPQSTPQVDKRHRDTDVKPKHGNVAPQNHNKPQNTPSDNVSRPPVVNNNTNGSVQQQQNMPNVNQPSNPRPIQQPPVNTQVNTKTNNNLVVAITAVVIVIVAVLAISVISSVTRNLLSNDTEDYIETVVDTPSDEIVEEPIAANVLEDSKIAEIVSRYTDYTDFGVYVKNLDTDYEYGYNEDDSFIASAMGQVVILDTLSRVLDKKNIDVDDEYIYFNYIMNGKEAPSSPDDDMCNIPLLKCIEDVAVYGDNNKSNHIVDYIADVYGVYNGFDVINDMLYDQGYHNTSINRKTFVDPDLVDYSVPQNSTTPKDIAKIFEHIVKHSEFGNERYMKNIFKSVSNDGKAIGLKKFVPSYYDVCNVNALTSQVTNNVAIIQNDDTELIISVLSTTYESKTGVEDNEIREKVLADIISYVLDNQFAD